ncbi:DsbA family oxidoreductase [Nakamurella flava]|uniref:DsbA family oxidoreductase n=1 Tax=Nakamurella flava TaxID=2576308 RepID=A0A4U6QLG7_9ACTN|nr:DsbA family oxidoreductase [Nakamurella flava]TKV61417.1 DsbA family oxidoreductase [Nakamurella flava]
MSAPLAVDIWSDIACPWCYIGKRKFEEGVRRFGGDVAVIYHSYELSPETPVDFDGSELDFLTAYKGQPRNVMQQMLDRVTEVARDAGLTYDFDRLQHTNTVLAHQLLHLARAHGRQTEMAERLFRAYFTEGRHIGRIDSLAELAAEIGLDPDEVQRALTAGEYLPAVRADQEQAQAYGIQGVPFFVIDGRYGISGAQDPDVFASALGQVAAELDGAAETVR